MFPYLAPSVVLPGDGVPLAIARPVLDGGVGDGDETGGAPVDLYRGVRVVGGGVKPDGVRSSHHLHSASVPAQTVGGDTLVLADVVLGHLLQYEGLVGGVAGQQDARARGGEEEVVVVPGSLTGRVTLHPAAQVELPLSTQQVSRLSLNTGTVYSN